ncbi:hypothetical protein NP233_g11241 [Leucocoprinus birnbaumii]|uniref:C2H2-type domain-containing protein n=1 Tax=Leucocoprinus birnbaumii TaxID=56174 RepID=A0AAD5VGW9_9AGAR|nr:hypothetical protein NP233_g11241 [Leucocoprinus birnbaumii]
MTNAIHRRIHRPARFLCPAPLCRKACRSERGLRDHYKHRHQAPTALQYRPAAEPQASSPSSAGKNTPPPSDLDIEPLNVSFGLPTTPGSPRLSPPPDLTPPTTSTVDRSLTEFELQGRTIVHHSLLTGEPCDADGIPVDPTVPPRVTSPTPDSNKHWPFQGAAEFELADFLFSQEEMSAKKIDRLMDILSTLYDQLPPFADHRELYSIVDSIKQGGVPWDSFTVQYNGPRPSDGEPVPPWMEKGYEVWYRDPLKVMEEMVSNPEFNGQIDYAPKRVSWKGKRQFGDVMSGNWAWRQADIIAENDANTHGAMFAPVILGHVRRAHRGAMTVIGFLAIPKTTQEYASKLDFRKFRRSLIHTSLERILASLRRHMLEPRLTRCGDGHYRWVIYGLGPYIADYPEQVLLACVVQNWCAKCISPPDDLDKSPDKLRSHIHTDVLLEDDAVSYQDLWKKYGIVGDCLPFTTAFPRADIHELLAPDLLHQIIKGTFKDHLVDWVEKYIVEEYKERAPEILADIDWRISVAPHFPGLRNFHEGRGFKQWTGDDSKGLMKVYLPAIAGHVPPDVVKAVAALIEFCYLVRRSTIDEDVLKQLAKVLSDFHSYREAFRNVRPDGFSLPRQHSLSHYIFLITEFGAPNGICSSITESLHIRAVKRPYRRSNRNNALGQMIVTNQRLDKLKAARTYFSAHGLLEGPNSTSGAYKALAALLGGEASERLGSDVEGKGSQEMYGAGAVLEPDAHAEVKLARTPVRGLPHSIDALAKRLKMPRLPLLTRRFLFRALLPEAQTLPTAQEDLPEIVGHVRVFESARAVFYAPSDISGLAGFHHERIQCKESWYGAPRRDCIFVANAESPEEPGFKGKRYECALVHWFSTFGEGPCEETGLWRVTPDFAGGQPVLEVIDLDTVLRGAHLIGVSGSSCLPKDPKFTKWRSLDSFKMFYVNKYVDHHAHEIAF